MSTQIFLMPPKFTTLFAPLAVIGYCVTHAKVLHPLREVELGIKTCQHAPHEKMQDVIVSVMANCSSIKQIDLRIRPDLVLAEAWGRAQCAEQSTLADTLNAFTETAVTELRAAVETIHQQQGQVFHHSFANELLQLDIDLTGLRASPHAQGSTKGYFSGKRNAYGRQVARISAPAYRETLFSKLYVGSQHGASVFKSTVLTAQHLLHLSPEHCRRTLLRTDAGLGTDANINWALSHNFQVLMKG